MTDGECPRRYIWKLLASHKSVYLHSLLVRRIVLTSPLGFVDLGIFLQVALLFYCVPGACQKEIKDISDEKRND